MKRRWYRILSVLLTVTMVAGLFPAEVSAQEPETESVEEVSENDAEDPYADTVSENEDVISENDAEENDADTVSENDAEENAGEEENDVQISEVDETDGAEEDDETEAVTNAAPDEEEIVHDEEPEHEEEVIYVSSWDELDKAFLKSTPRKYLRIILTADLSMDGSALRRDDTSFEQYSVLGHVTLDFNGHTLSGVLDAPNDDKMMTWAFLRFLLQYGDVIDGDERDQAPVLTFDDTVGGGGVKYEAMTYIDYPCQAVDIVMSDQYNQIYGGADGVRKWTTGAWDKEGNVVIVNGGEFFLLSSNRKVGKGSRGSYNNEIPWFNWPWGTFAQFTRSAFSVKGVDLVINDGKFTAVGIGPDGMGENTAARELSALGFAYGKDIEINGGLFQSGGYAVKYYKPGNWNNIKRERFPKINGGIFRGGINFTGKDFYYLDKSDQEGFDNNRNISANMIFGEDVRLFVNEKEKDPTDPKDLKFRDLETKDLIEVYSKGESNCANIKDIKINNESQEGKNSYACRRKTKLKVEGSSVNVPEWITEAFPGQIYLKNRFEVCMKDAPDDILWSSEVLGLNPVTEYTPTEPGEHTLRLIHQVCVGDRVISDDIIEKTLVVEDNAISSVYIDYEWLNNDNNEMSLILTGLSDTVESKGVIMSMFNKQYDKVMSGDKIDIGIVLKPTADWEWGTDVKVMLGQERLYHYVEDGDGARRYLLENVTVPVPEEGLNLSEVIITLSEPAVGNKLTDPSTSYATKGPKPKWVTTQPVEIDEILWMKDCEVISDPSNEVFEAGHIYSYTATLAAGEDYHFTKEPKVIRTDSGRSKDVEICEVLLGDGRLWITESFVIPNADGTIPELHTWIWEHDDQKHWQRCIGCDEIDNEASHKFGKWEEEVEPDADSYGRMARVCSECGYIKYWQILNNVNLEIEFPKVGDPKTTPDILVPEHLESAFINGYDYWYEPNNEWITMFSDDVFKAGIRYRMWIGIFVDPGYALSANTKITINDSMEATYRSRNSGELYKITYEFELSDTKLESISITKAPDKTTYLEGESFDPAGMVVTAKYDDKSTQAVTGYTYTPDGALTTADKEITVSYSAGGITKTAKQKIKVNENKIRTLSSIAVTNAPDKTVYNAGEFFEPAGMVVTASYDDNSTEVVTAYTYKPTSALKAGDTEIVISYTEGNITKTTTQPITVIDKNESLYVTFTEGDSFVYTGTKITPAVAVMYRGKALVEGVDYTVKYKNNVKTSDGASKLPTVTVTGKTVAASGSRTFTITRKDIDDPDVTAAGITVAKGKTASPVLFYAGRKLGKNDINNPDAKVKFETDGTITIEGKGNYTGKRTIDVKVVDEKKIQVTAFNPTERIYNGLEQPLAASELTVVSGSTTLELDKDYEINYPADITSAGTVKITIVGIGEYSGSVSKSYKISPCTAGINVDVPASVQYKAGGATPEVTVTNGTDKLIAGRDYTLKYSNNKSANGKKPASVKVTFKGSYKGAAAVTKDFSITALDISTAMPKIYGDEKAYIKSGKYLKAPYVELNGTLLTAKDMDVTYKIDGKDAKAGDKITDDMMAAGKVTVEVTVSGKGNYTGTVTGSYTISKAEKTQDISKAGVKLDKKSYAFTGEKIKPAVTVQIGKGANAVTLKEGVDYKVEYFANINKGKATIVITGLGDNGTGTTKYYGSKKISFKIDKGTLNWL